MNTGAAQKARRLLVPEVIQTSAMDCGPATLKAMLEGYGIRLSYGRLREACQTELDGTSIDNLEALGAALGLESEQQLLPLDHLLLDECDALPAIVVSRLPSGFTHFVIVWRRHGPLVQVMDPGRGRLWQTRDELLSSVYRHTHVMPARDWRDWAGSSNFLQPLTRRMGSCGARASASKLISEAVADPTWARIATLDAAVRMVDALVRSGSLARRSASRTLAAVCQHAAQAPPGPSPSLPEPYWSVLPGRDAESLRVKGAVLVRMRRLSEAVASAQRLPVELEAALNEPPARPLAVIAGALARARLEVGLVVAATVLTLSGTLLEAVLLRGLLDASRLLAVTEQRVVAVVALGVLFAVVWALELPAGWATLRLGRTLEIGFRQALLQKIPQLADRYFQSRPVSDMAERSHNTHQLRQLPEVGVRILRSVAELVAVTAAIILLSPHSAGWAVSLSLAVVLVPLLGHGALAERDLRLRTYLGTLVRFHFDALLGLVPVKTHSAERGHRREHESLLVDWQSVGRSLQHASLWVEGTQRVATYGLLVGLVLSCFGRGESIAAVLLIVYWAMRLTALGQELTVQLKTYPMLWNLALRLLEPLGALEVREPPGVSNPDANAAPQAMDVELAQVSVKVSGHEVLRDVNLSLPPGSHVAVVGPSGSGKSTLVGLLLGFYRPSSGSVLMDGTVADDGRWDELRAQTSWVDPSVQLWNRSLLQNLEYGAGEGETSTAAEVIESADLIDVLERLPAGQQTELGEGGGSISGGEGQRVRLGRALLRKGARLVILDEPFRGLERHRRRELLVRLRQQWIEATLICVTHDVADTLDFPRVVVVDDGTVSEDGTPAELLARPDSRYRALTRAEEEIRKMWTGDSWRRKRLENGRLVAVDDER